jgi:eukaryotic-like serine/threonine-protein kinase
MSQLESLTAALAERYAVLSELGYGGMATVYLAQDLRHDRRVALKVLRPELASVLGPERFLREVRITAKLQHPHVLTLIDSGEACGFLYYVMPFVEGESLRDRLRLAPRLPLEEALRIAAAAAGALDYAHRQGVIHRDIKPENILLHQGEAMVADFGIAFVVSGAGERLTEVGLSLGTPAYMSPEQACGAPDLDGRSDIYSLGCVLYEMLAGEPPFTGPSPQVVLARRLTDPVPDLRAVREVPEAVERVVSKALARNPTDRFASAAEFARAVNDATTGPGATARLQAAGSALGRASRGWRPAWVARITAGVVVVLAGVWLAVGKARAPAPAVARTRLAVLPFAAPVSGSFAYLAEGMVDLLSRNLNGAEALRTVDPGSVLSAVGRGSGAPDVKRGRAIAHRLGAGLYVLGGVHAVGSRLRIQALLYDEAGESPEPAAQATVEGDSARLFELVDRLSAELLVKRGRGQGARLAQTAALTTHSLPALRAYLDAERNLRAAQFDSAIAGFQRAVEEDSTFALAYYRLAVSAGWASHMGLSGPAIARALAFGQRLSERERRLLTAFAAFRRGAANDAEQQYRAILSDYPGDMEGEFQLATVLYNYNAPRGRSRGEALELYNRVLAVDPEFICPI